jgi:2'-5' RNA ligase
MRHRVFIAINFPPAIKERLYSIRDKLSNLPCRWTKKENLHLTLLFLGYLNDQEVLETCQIVSQIGKKHSPFSLGLEKIIPGPPGKSPRLVWAVGKPSNDLAELQRDLESALFERIPNDNEKGRSFAPHATLARIKQWELQKMEAEEVPEINQEISLSFPVDSIEVMESELKREGPEYHVLESAPLSR